MITGNPYECAYADYAPLQTKTRYDDMVAEVLKESAKAISPAEINVRLCKKMGYTALHCFHSWVNDGYFMSPQKMGSILSHMKLAGCVEIIKEPYGEPVTYTKEEKVWIEPANEPRLIEVTDTHGRHFTIINPLWNPDSAEGHYEWKMIEHTVQPTRKLYKWVRG